MVASTVEVEVDIGMDPFPKGVVLMGVVIGMDMDMAIGIVATFKFFFGYSSAAAAATVASAGCLLDGARRCWVLLVKGGGDVSISAQQSCVWAEGRTQC